MIDDVTHWLLEASEHLPPQYFQLPVASKEEPEYRERVYCYELYHQWRLRWPDGFPFSLCGEVDKTGHPLIRDAPKPDFIVHLPGEMTNLLAMEVKPCNSSVSRMAADLAKLVGFRKEIAADIPPGGNYEAAYFWIYGLDAADWPDLRQKLIKNGQAPPHADLGLVSCFLHENPGTRAVRVDWGNAVG